MGDFQLLLEELSTTRATLESLKSAGGHLAERATMRSRLHSLRADIAMAREERAS